VGPRIHTVVTKKKSTSAFSLALLRRAVYSFSRPLQQLYLSSPPHQSSNQFHQLLNPTPDSPAASPLRPCSRAIGRCRALPDPALVSLGAESRGAIRPDSVRIRFLRTQIRVICEGAIALLMEFGILGLIHDGSRRRL
jgi:hypothetical protein